MKKTTQTFNSRCYLFSIYFVLQTKSKLFTHLSIVLCLKFQFEYAVNLNNIQRQSKEAGLTGMHPLES